MFRARVHGTITSTRAACQYTTIAFGRRCTEMSVLSSMSSVGDAYDNTMAESFFPSLEWELLDRRSWKSKTETQLAVFTWIQAWFKPRRRHSTLQSLSPLNYERKRTTVAHEPGLPTEPLASSHLRPAAAQWTTLRQQ